VGLIGCYILLRDYEHLLAKGMNEERVNALSGEGS
jgi:hypothetical protein